MIAPEGSSCGSVPVEHLDYSFIQSCSDLKHLEQILRVLQSGQEGFYPDLVEFCETHIGKLFPRSRVLRKENRASTAGSFSSEEWRNICEDLQMWERNMRADEEELKRSAVSSDVEPVPPVRSSNARVQRSVSTAVKTGKTSHIPRPYQDWDRFDVEAECSKIDEISTTIRPERPTVKQTVSSTALTAQEKHTLARREKDKGNDAFRSGDYEEAMLYYSRSLSLAPSVAALNNRAQTLIRLERWSAALSDCDAALLLEPHNCKALLRRATVRKHLCLLQESRDDLRTVLLLEPHNTTAQKLLRGETEQESRGTGRKILVQEVDEEEDEGVQHESRREKRDESEAESGIMGNTHTMKTDSAGAPPTGHTHREHEEHTPLNNTQAISEHTAAELQRLTDEADGCLRSGCYQDALQRYTHCLQLHPQQCAVYTSRALCFIRLQLFTEARQDCDSALQIQPTNKKALYRRALANKGLKDYPACRSDLQQLLCLDASVTEAEQLLMEMNTHLMNHTHPAAARRTVHITEVDDEEDDDDDGDDDDGDDEGQDGGAGGSSTVPQVCDVFEFGQDLLARGITTPDAAPGHTHPELHHPSAAHTPAAHTPRAGAADPATAARHTPIPCGVDDVGS